jgi:hypothetical protein
MSNALSIATVMGALNMRVQTLLNDAGLSGFDVNNGHPRANAGSGVYLSLYQLVPNAGLRNMDLPTRDASGDVRTRPVLPMTLRILFSFVGDEEQLEPERLAGLVLSDLHARPVLSPGEIDAYLSTLAGSHPLRPSDLAQQPERVKLSPVSLDSEELSRIWGLFGQNVFALSMAWEVTSVLLDGSISSAPGLPVSDVGLVVVPAPVPRLTAAYEETTRQPVAESDSTLVVEGSGMMSEAAELVIGTARRALAPSDLVDGRLSIPLASVTGLRAGVQPVIVEHTIVVPGASGGGARPGPVSNALGLMLRPQLGTITTAAAVGGNRTVRLATTPVIEPEQRCELILDGTAGRHTARIFVRNGGDIEFTFSGLAAGTYRVQLTVDGAANLPTRSADVYDGPTVTVP